MKALLTAAALSAMATGALAADYGYTREEYTYQTPPPPVYVPPQQQTVIVNPPPVVQQTYVVRPHREWNPVAAIMAVPRAALAVPGRVLGLEDEQEDY